MSGSTENEPSSFEDNPVAQQQRWTAEFAAARKALGNWHAKGDVIDKEFRNEGPADEGEQDNPHASRLPLFTSDIILMVAMLFGQVPKVDVSRRFGDSTDDKGRVAGEILQRILNTDISRRDDTYVVALRCALMDFFLPGFGNMRCRYVEGEGVTKETVQPELDANGKELVEGYELEHRPNEDVEIDYVHWKDWLWGPAKVLHQVPWWATKQPMTKSQLVKRFGEVGNRVPLAKKDDGTEDPWSRADVWEIWDKETRKVYWLVEGFDRTLDIKPDLLGIEGFYPFPVSEALAANLTTSKVVPRPYYSVHQDQYKFVNALMTRRYELLDALRVAGFYDASNEELQTLLEFPGRNKLFPVRNWAKLQGNGGAKGAIEWFPLEQIVNTLAVVTTQLVQEIDLLHQTTGFADILRGEATQAGATATEQRAKVKSASVRVQRLQDVIAMFATEVLRIKGEIVCKRFSPETIKARANVRFMPEADQLLADEAIALLKSDFACYRIEVKPEAVALADFAQMKAERTETLAALTSFFQAGQPIVATMPGSLPYLLKIAQWAVAGVRGSSQIEGVFDQMIAAAEQAAEEAAKNPQPQQQDPKVVAEQMKQQTVAIQGQQKARQEQMKHEHKMVEVQAEVVADAQREENQRQSNVNEFAQRQAISAATRPPPTVSPNGRKPVL